LGSGVLSPSSLGDVVGTNALEHSSEWKLGDDVEWSIDMESEILVETLSLESFLFIMVDNSPSLVNTSVSLVDNNSLSFNILVSRHIKNLLVINVHEEW
jgi:hypothetical protein